MCRPLPKRARGLPGTRFHEGPPTANGRPGIHHVLSRAFKDIFPRYKIMQGYYVQRRGGWDTHGLPVEIEVEKQLGLSGKQQIEAYGVEEFNRRCRASAQEYIEDWERMTVRMGFWVDLKTAYVTFHNSYIESLWWILKQFWEQDLLYQGYKVVPYCPRCGTPLSSHELSQGYKEGTIDPSVYVKFKAKGEENAYLLAWTTTPWTLPGNPCHRWLDYVKVRDAGAMSSIWPRPLPIPSSRRVMRCWRLKGSDLLGMRYEPLYRFYPVDKVRLRGGGRLCEHGRRHRHRPHRPGLRRR